MSNDVRLWVSPCDSLPSASGSLCTGWIQSGAALAAALPASGVLCRRCAMGVSCAGKPSVCLSLPFGAHQGALSSGRFWHCPAGVTWIPGARGCVPQGRPLLTPVPGRSCHLCTKQATVDLGVPTAPPWGMVGVQTEEEAGRVWAGRVPWVDAPPSPCSGALHLTSASMEAPPHLSFHGGFSISPVSMEASPCRCDASLPHPQAFPRGTVWTELRVGPVGSAVCCPARPGPLLTRDASVSLDAAGMGRLCRVGSKARSVGAGCVPAPCPPGSTEVSAAQCWGGAVAGTRPRYFTHVTAELCPSEA